MPHAVNKLHGGRPLKSLLIRRKASSITIIVMLFVH